MGNIFILDISLDMPISWLASGLRFIGAFFDFIVYTLIQIFFRTIFNLANFELVGFYESFEERVYVILGIFMLFKVTVSMLSYLVSPDKINDKEQGMAKVVTRIITVLIMLIALPTAFNLLTEFQNKLLPVVPRVIIGTTNTLNSDSVESVANTMSVTMLQGFAHMKEGCDGTPFSDPIEFLADVNKPCSESNNIYKYDYLPFISTIVGALMCYVLFLLCITTAIRAFKLIILRAMAPVPIISYVDPKSSKNGMFSTWIKTFLSTWAELFVLIGIIYFIVYIIDFLLSGQAWKGFFDGINDPVQGILLLAFILIGLLFFARQAPQFIFDALGIKNKGAFTRMLGMGATALGMGGSVASQFRARNIENPDHRGRNFAASLFGGLASGATGANALLSTDKPTWRTGIDQIEKSKAVALSRIEGHSTLGGRLLSGVENILGIPTRYETLNNKVTAYNSATDAWKRIDTALNSDTQNIVFDDPNGTIGDVEIGVGTNREIIINRGSTDYSAKSINDLLERMKTSGQYSAREIEQVEEVKKRIQQNRFDQIRTTAPADVNSLTGTAAQIYAGAETIFKIGRQYSGDSDRVFANFAGATSIADASLDSLSGHFKGVAYNAGRQADVIKASAEYISADADAKRQRGK